MTSGEPNHGAQLPGHSRQVADALHTLGVGPGASWHEIRRAYRRQLRQTHPDLDHDNRQATERTARLNSAWAVIEELSDGGRVPIPSPPADPPPAQREPAVTLVARPGDVFVQLLEAAYEVGDVSYIDPEAGLIQVLLEQGGPAASQLLIDVNAETEPPSASFTLDSMHAENAPELRAIVDRIARALGS